MASELTPIYDSDTGQVVLEGLPTGAAGGAGLVPVAGLELVFDRADGRLARAVVATGQPGSPVSSGGAAAGALEALFGQQAPATVRDVAERGIQRALAPDARLSAIWSRLARLDSARATSPVPASPLWAAEAAHLAERAGLPSRARAEAQRAATGLAELLNQAPLLPEALCRAALAVADIVEPDQPGAAGQLRDYAGKLPAGSLEQWLAEQPDAPTLPGAAQGGSPGADEEQIPGLQWSLDPSLVPAGVFLHGLSPLSDLIVRPRDVQDRVIVEALLAPGADRVALSRCRARLVDPSTRRVIASAPFMREGSRIRVELTHPCPIDELKGSWVEVVDDEQRPVRSEHLRQMRRALRWADAALRAEHCPQGLAPQFTGQDWTALAITAWERCGYDWEDIGDTGRAFLAARRLAGLNPPARVPEASSAWTADLADSPPLHESAFLAEAIGR